MSPENIHTNGARVAGAILGVGLALALVLVSLPAATSSPLPATVRVSMVPAGELEVTPSPPSPILLAGALRPGEGPASADFQVRNQTGSDLEVALRTSADSTVLDGLLRVRLSDSGGTLADTTLQGMRQRSLGLRLRSGERARLRIQLWIPSDVLSGFEGRLVHVSLAPTVRTVGGRR
ncbi:MAG TPA: hypothetical protein VEW07_13435 [Solirubrobacterales bacterium]|nr:hypothetical protein [Solirubrobacterales bacterium]